MKNHQYLALLFWHRKSKQDKKGYAPIICRLSIGGQQPEELSIGRKVRLDDWDVKNKKAIGGIDWQKTNLKIREVEVDLMRIFMALQTRYEVLTPLMIKTMCQGLPEKLQKNIPKPVDINNSTYFIAICGSAHCKFR